MSIMWKDIQWDFSFIKLLGELSHIELIVVKQKYVPWEKSRLKDFLRMKLLSTCDRRNNGVFQESIHRAIVIWVRPWNTEFDTLGKEEKALADNGKV